jgi:hypothetical protein
MTQQEQYAQNQITRLYKGSITKQQFSRLLEKAGIHYAKIHEYEDQFDTDQIIIAYRDGIYSQSEAFFRLQDCGHSPEYANTLITQ